MRTILSTFLLTLLFGIFLTADAKTGEVKLRVAQEKTAPGTAIKIKFMKVVEDSRCPEGVNCIWAGVARVKIQLRKTGKTAKEFELNTNQTDKSITFEGHTIKLAALTPYPKANMSYRADSYSATLTITKLPK
ncbi:MAG: hypothetical protein WBD27_19685 [Pyrinomonadaceae bacterium]